MDGPLLLNPTHIHPHQIVKPLHLLFLLQFLFLGFGDFHLGESISIELAILHLAFDDGGFEIEDGFVVLGVGVAAAAFVGDLAGEGLWVWVWGTNAHTI